MDHELVRWLVRYGTPLLFFAQAFGIFGLPIPDELLLTVAGALAASGRLNPFSTFAAAVCGCLTGITLSYVVGRSIGLAELSARFLGHHEAIERAQHWFRRFGGWLLTFGYFIPGVRHVTAILAGSSGFDYRTFAAYTYPGGVLWCAVFLGLGYFAGDRWRQVYHVARTHSPRVALIIAGAIVAYATVRVVAERRRT